LKYFKKGGKSMSCLVEFKRVYEVLPGVHFDEAVNKAIAIAKAHDCIVNFMFNGVDIWVFKDSTLSFTRKEYEKNYRLYYKIDDNQECPLAQLYLGSVNAKRI
jgi:hypothetical protein